MEMEVFPYINYYMVGREKNMKGKERRGGMRIGINGKIPQDEES